MEHIADANRRIVEAEKILDEALGALGFHGTFGEKLKKAGPRFGDPEAVWRAHKLRNRIAHEIGVDVTADDARRTLLALRRALNDLS